MAEGGIPVDSVLGQHEELFEHTCTRCGFRGKNVKSSCYCRSCHQFFCKFRDDHEEIVGEHAELDASESNLCDIPRTMNLGMDECPLHEGQHITIFCGQHEALGCTVCASLIHSSCEKKNFVPNLAKDIANNQEMDFVRSRIRTLQERLRIVKTAKEQIKTSLKDSRTNCKKTVAEFRFKVEHVFSNIVKTTNANMDQLYQIRYNELENHLDICDTLIQEFADLQAKLADDSMVDTKRFVIMKQGKETILECTEKLNNLSQPMHYDIVFSPDKSVLDIFERGKYLWQFRPNPALGKSTKITGVENMRQYTVRATEDKKTCDIRGICMLADGTIILSDHSNRNIKRLDENYVIHEVCPMPGNPNGVCCTGKRSVAVALGSKKKVQIVSVTDKMRTTEEHIFKHNCNGIACYKDAFYITGGWKKVLYEYTLVKSSDGTTCNLIRTFDATFQRSVAVSGDGCFVYFVGNNEKLTIQNRHGNIVQYTEHPNLKKYRAEPDVCVDMKGNVIVSLQNAGIIQFKDSGTEPNGILIKDEVAKPGLVFVDHVKSNLIVVQRNNKYDLSDTMEVLDLVY